VNSLAGVKPGQTPLEPDEAVGLIPSWIATREDLDKAEEENIARAQIWAAGRTLSPADVLTDRFIRQLHRRMFGKVWRWAGTYRQSDKNIGTVPHWRIVQDIGQLLGDTAYWIEHRVFSRDEIAIRFHHRLVWIHPFPNGNGRATRLVADLLVEALGGERFSWGIGVAPDDPKRTRDRYIAALQSADRGDYAPLHEFTRS
jgi:Fic-DOC domain mobile mystery protein B